MKDDSRENRRRARLPRHLPRLALLACLALVVISLGMVLQPGKPQEPQEPPPSERARAAALADALQLKAAGEQLGAAPSDPAIAAPAAAALPAVTRTVSLLTTQARALLPGPVQAAQPAPTTSAPTASAPATVTNLVADLARSGRQRLTDAAAADGGMARLLAAVGTGQLLQSSSLAAAAGIPDPAAGLPDLGPAAAATAGPSCPAAPASAGAPGGSGAGTGADGNAGLPGALAALIRTELETVYDYQVALTRLDGAAAKTAAEDLARHEALVAGAESLSRAHCAPIPPREAGYALDPAFLASPGPGLAALETAALPAYGDLVAFSDGDTRRWAITGLVAAARRAAFWGATTDAVPGLAADPATFPTLPSG
ncbi:ferritin-like domain-containing protein [Arthrobacter sp. UKPF54-2]|uniref:ferritin-like domain-containing protein n=1 Tax=Arthrobacter sp. UKPF54-2 TaxID=2600159 RepID=UPI00164575FF|nr:ferritin-like domain-containing protein [Arthrobacter sp. UKPF54-2]